MRKGKISKEKLVSASAELFWKKGYHYTSIRDILDATGLTKGSFYFYFENKEELAKAVVAFYEKLILDLLQTAAEGRTWKDFCVELVHALQNQLQDYRGCGCPFAVLGMEFAFEEPEILGVYQASLEKICDIFRDVLSRSGIPQEQLDDTARFCLSIYEGNLLLYRIRQDERQIDVMKKELLMGGTVR